MKTGSGVVELGIAGGQYSSVERVDAHEATPFRVPSYPCTLVPCPDAFNQLFRRDAVGAHRVLELDNRFLEDVVGRRGGGTLRGDHTPEERGEQWSG